MNNKLCNIPLKLIKATKDNKKIILTVADDDGFQNCVLSASKCKELIDILNDLLKKLD